VLLQKERISHTQWQKIATTFQNQYQTFDFLTEYFSGVTQIWELLVHDKIPANSTRARKGLQNQSSLFHISLSLSLLNTIPVISIQNGLHTENLKD